MVTRGKSSERNENHMSCPPNPGRVAVLIAAILALAYDQAKLGFQGKHITVVSAGHIGSCVWGLVDSLPAGCAPRFMDQETLEAIKVAKVWNEELVINDEIYRLSDVYDEATGKMFVKLQNVS